MVFPILGVLISSTFYMQLFCTKLFFLLSFSVLTFWICHFLAKPNRLKSCSWIVGEIDHSDNITICDPWQTLKFMNYLENDTISNEACSLCLPDCNGTIYDREISTVPFRRCDSSNLGTSSFCSIFNPQISKPGVAFVLICNTVLLAI